MKMKEELNALKEEVETLNKKLAELTEEELAQVFGGQTGINSQISAICFGISDKNGEMKAAADFTGKIKYPGFGNLDESK